MILVTGGGGYIGSVLVRRLLNLGHWVRVLDNLTYTGCGILPVLTHGRFEFMNGDVRSVEDCRRALRGVDAVVHLAAIVGERACDVDRHEADRVNIVGAQNVYLMAQEEHVRHFIFASTCSNYGISELADEDAELKPLGHYAKTKVEMERWLQRHYGDLPYTVLRFATAFGVSPRMRFDLLINELVESAYSVHQITVYNEESWRPFCHVLDIARAIQHTVAKGISYNKSVYWKTFNVGGTNITKGALAEIIKLRWPDTSVWYTGTGKGRDYRVDFSRIRSLGWADQLSIAQGCVEIWGALDSGVFDDVGDSKWRNA